MMLHLMGPGYGLAIMNCGGFGVCGAGPVKYPRCFQRFVKQIGPYSVALERLGWVMFT